MNFWKKPVRFLTICVAALTLAACSTEDEVGNDAPITDAGDAGSAGGDTSPDGGTSRCEGPNPMGCRATGCPADQACRPTGAEGCMPSACSCEEATGLWTCTADCGPVYGCVPRMTDDVGRPDTGGSDAGGDDTGGSDAGGDDTGPSACEGPNPQGCRSTGCPTGERCVQPPDSCIPSSCGCDEASGNWFCTEDCGGGVCMPSAMECDEDTDCPPGEGCANGVCEGIGCPTVYEPVCGVDGRTYGNACEAGAYRVAISHEGECGTESQCRTDEDCPPEYPVCVSTCLPDPNCPECDVCLEGGICVRPEPPQCEGPNPAGCSEANPCGLDQTCMPLSGRCLPSQCSCDPETGSWVCTRDCGGGVCVPTEPGGSCASDSECTWGREWCEQGTCEECDNSGLACLILCAPGFELAERNGCRPCECVPIERECESNRDCARGESCVDGRCETTFACYDLWAPVCGTDGQTYSNDCYARAAGVEIAYEGECRTERECRSNADCRRGLICDPSTAKCQPRCSIECLIADPVCGSDGVTYTCGEADAHCNGATVVHAGACGTQEGCYGDDDCGDGLVCNAGEVCLPDPSCPMCTVCYGYCVAPEEPTSCRSDADCAYGEEWCEEGSCGACDNSGRLCRIACPEGTGLVTRNGCTPCECQPLPRECRADGDCSRGEYCAPGYCPFWCAADDADCCEPATCQPSQASACREPNPAGCTQSGCAPGFRCNAPDLDGCAPSACSCDAEAGTWICTADCGGGGSCVAVEEGRCDTNDDCQRWQRCNVRRGICEDLPD